jgi:cell division protein ZipA
MEADVLRWSLLVIGTVVILGLAVHGIWVSRKNNDKKVAAAKKLKSQQRLESDEQQTVGDMFNEDRDIDIHTNDPAFSSIIDPVVDGPSMDFDADESTTTKTTSFVGEQSELSPEFDDLGLGAVRVVSAAEKPESKTTAAPAESESESESKKTNLDETKKFAKSSDSKIYASVVTQPKPEYAAKYQSLAAETVAISQQEKVNSSNHRPVSKGSSADSGANASQNFTASGHYQAPEPPPFLLKKQANESIDTQPLDSGSPTMVETINQSERKPNLEAVNTNSANTAPSSSSSTESEKLSLGEQARNLVKRKKSESIKKRHEPKIAEDQMRIDFDDAPTPQPESAEVPKPKDSKAQPQNNPQPQQEVLVLNVKMPDGESIPGAALLPMLLTLGFKFGDQDIFHRHVNSNGKGPVLFSLANMFKPGNFDIDHLENFTTQGVSLFMILPIEGEPHQVFNMMHNAARKIADEFSGQIYDGRRALLTKQSLQQYVEKIREFERQRILVRQ